MKITKKLLTKIIKEEMIREMSEEPKRQSLYRARKPFPEGFNEALLKMYKDARRGEYKSYKEDLLRRALKQIKQINNLDQKIKAVAYLLVMKLLCESGEISLRSSTAIEQSAEKRMGNIERFLSRLFVNLGFQVNDVVIDRVEDNEEYAYKIWEDMLHQVGLVNKAKLYEADPAVLYAKPRDLAKEFFVLVKDYEAIAGREQTRRDVDASEYGVS